MRLGTVQSDVCVASGGCFDFGNRLIVSTRFFGRFRCAFMMACHLAERRPGGARCDILAAAAAASKMRANVGDGESRAELRDEDRDRHDSVMPASVAPAEDTDPFLLQFTEDRGVPAPFFFLQMLLFHTSHDLSRPVVPKGDAIYLLRCRKKKNITGTFSAGQAPVKHRSNTG